MTPAPVDRLRDGRDVAAVLRGRRQRAGRLAVVHVRERGDDGPVRVAVVASRRVGAAVTRNRAKRLLREASRSVTWRSGLDLVLVARAAAGQSRRDDVLRELIELGRKLGLLTDEADGRQTSRGPDRQPGYSGTAA